MSNANRSMWLFPRNEPGKVLGWETITGKYLENKAAGSAMAAELINDPTFATATASNINSAEATKAFAEDTENHIYEPRPVAAPGIVHNVGDWMRQTRYLKDFSPASTPSDWGPVLQEAWTECMGSYGEIVLPYGNMAVSTTAELDMTLGASITDNFSLMLRGQGKRGSRFVVTTAIPAIKIQGALDGGPDTASFAKFSDFGVVGNGTGTGIGIDVSGQAYAVFYDLFMLDLGTGFNSEDFLSSRFYNCYFRRNTIGVYLRDKTTFSSPNAIDFFGCNLGQNTQWGMIAEESGGVNWYGGSIEKNGTASTTDFGGIQLLDPSLEGNVSARIYDAYIEGNKGVADLWIRQGADESLTLVKGCDFRRIHVTDYVVNNIRLSQSTAAGDVFARLIVEDCAFSHHNDYVPNSGRRYIHPDANGEYDIQIIRPHYENGSATELPLIPRVDAFANGFISGGTGTPSCQGRNLSATVGKPGTGRYTITLLRDIPGTNWGITVDPRSAASISFAFSKSGKDIEIRCTNDAGTLTDLATFRVEVWAD